jgi:hypothetical protein
MSIRASLLLGSLVLISDAALAAAPATGHVDFHGQSWDVADAMAYTDGEYTAVAISSKAFDRAAFAKDGKIDAFDFMRHDASTITLKVDAEGKSNCIDFSLPNGGGSSCGSFGDAFKLARRDAKSIAGSMDAKSGEDRIKVSFDVPIAPDKIERAGTKLAAGGGEPGKALMAHLNAIWSGDFAKLKATAPPEKRKMMEESEKSGEAKEMFGFMRSITPTKVKVLGGSVDGDHALLDFEGEEDGKKVTGTAELTRQGGVWYVDGTSTKH